MLLSFVSLVQFAGVLKGPLDCLLSLLSLSGGCVFQCPNCASAAGGSDACASLAANVPAGEWIVQPSRVLDLMDSLRLQVHSRATRQGHARVYCCNKGSARLALLLLLSPRCQYSAETVEALLGTTIQLPCAQETWRLFRYLRGRGVAMPSARLRQALQVWACVPGVVGVGGGATCLTHLTRRVYCIGVTALSRLRAPGASMGGLPCHEPQPTRASANHR